MTSNYDAALLEHNLHPSHRGTLSNNSSKILSSTYKNESCGDEITIFLKTKNGQLLDASWEGNGCALSKASADILCATLLSSTDKTSPNDRKIAMRDNEVLLRTRKNLPGRTKCLDTPLLALAHLLKTSPGLASALKPLKTA